MEGTGAAPSRPRKPSLPDCWTKALKIVDGVNSGRGAGCRSNRTDVQCKNRFDILKNKFWVEEVRIAGGDAESQWPPFSRLDALIGCATSAAKKPPSRRCSPCRSLSIASVPPREKPPAFSTAFLGYGRFFRLAAAVDEEEVLRSLSRSSSRSGRGWK
ncbi:hypothetical protein C4D60_Mb04t01110 [Musa balbisiana]|uniref:Myb/SANT-like domain-containing protein n=1 Tax=Musa balbisiana TaxID=52838 RepID=A0A4S8K8T4_MUSBA|nr:hypothetical protein C4D60_Mb04t01110 [Musa balbisiana]